MKLPQNKNSILRKIMTPMIVLMVIQSGLFALTLTLGDTFMKLSVNALDILNERVINRRNYLENDMLQRWSNIGTAPSQLEADIRDLLGDEKLLPAHTDVTSKFTTDLFAQFAPNLVSLMRKNSVSGAFILFDNNGSPNKTSLYLRDSDPTSNPSDNSDLTILRGPIGVIKQIGIPTDVEWTAYFDFENSQISNSDFFYKPFNAAKTHPEISQGDLGYWSKTFALSPTDKRIITYSEPIYDSEMEPIGIIGVEISYDYLRTLLPNDELSASYKGSYALATEIGNSKIFETIAPTGPLYKEIFGSDTNISLLPKPHEKSKNNFQIEKGGRVKEDAYANVQYFKLYNSNTPFENERWALLGIMETSDLFSIPYSIIKSVASVSVFSIILGILGIILTSSFLTKPITTLVNDLALADPSQPITLPKVNIFEIDELSGAVENMSSQVVSSARRMSRVFELSGMAIGAFEYNKENDQLFCSDQVLNLLGKTEEYGELSYDQLLTTIAGLDSYHTISINEDGGSEMVYNIICGDGVMRWMRMRLINDDEKVVGLITDATPEILEKRKIEYERDYDSLTNLLNRRAFNHMMQDIFNAPDQIKTGALVMLDLDNLKYINDTYGHDYGDDYICCTADILRTFSPAGSIVSRMAGDEFYVFIYGYDSKDEIRPLIDNLKFGISSTTFPMPNHENFKVRASAGVSWYPSDSTNFDQLMKYADFAMYKVKNTVKGEFYEFEVVAYDKDSYLLDSREDLNKLIDEKLVDYHFQPIVDARTGEVHAYEALMRSRLPTLSNPFEVLNMARSQYKLYQIEKLTWFRSLECFDLTSEKFSDTKLFINSISNQMLTSANISEFAELYNEYLPRLVVELTEEEKPEETMTIQKVSTFEKLGIEIAIDDFGTGYNGDAALLVVNPHYLKIDMSIVRNVDKDISRQLILQNILYYSGQKGIKIIAEGVETREEMVYLIKSGVDYLQGYYLGRPQPLPFAPHPEVCTDIQQISGTAEDLV